MDFEYHKRVENNDTITILRFATTAVVDSMQFDILPYVLFMIVPVLGRMSDPDESMRLLATQTFATLVKLVPLEVS